jgi:hypothetical protein
MVLCVTISEPYCRAENLNKRNTQDNAKGVNRVRIDTKGDFTSCFGEAKFYNSIANVRLGTIANSAFECFTTDRQKKENAIITNVSDLDVLLRPKPLQAAG